MVDVSWLEGSSTDDLTAWTVLLQNQSVAGADLQMHNFLCTPKRDAWAESHLCYHGNNKGYLAASVCLML